MTGVPFMAKLNDNGKPIYPRPMTATRSRIVRLLFLIGLWYIQDARTRNMAPVAVPPHHLFCAEQLKQRIPPVPQAFHPAGPFPGIRRRRPGSRRGSPGTGGTRGTGADAVSCGARCRSEV